MKNYDAIIVGAGAAGLSCALSLAPLKVLVIRKNDQCNSQYAQGGIAAALKDPDSPEQHFRDTIEAGHQLGNQFLIKILTQKAPQAISFLQEQGVLFDGSCNHEAAHQYPRVWRAGGDATGKKIMEALLLASSKADHIDFYNNFFVKDIICNQSKACGVIGINADNDWQHFFSQRIILATGGMGQLYSHTTNNSSATGDGIAMAMRAGVQLNQMEMIQFHPTAMDLASEQMPLISEALRGAGAKLVNQYGEQFTDELAPRDIVAREIWKQESVYLNARHINNLSERFPTITKICYRNGIDPTKSFIPITPAAHYCMGGIQCDECGRTNLSGLWAVGECAGSGVHGANRLASNSLLECIVFAGEVAADSKKYHNSESAPAIPIPKLYSAKDITKIKKQLQTIMFEAFGLVRSKDVMHWAHKEIKRIKDSLVPTNQISHQSIELENLIDCANAVAKAAIANQQSIGAHYLIPGRKNEFTSISTHY